MIWMTFQAQKIISMNIKNNVIKIYKYYGMQL